MNKKLHDYLEIKEKGISFYVCDEMQNLRDRLDQEGIEWKDHSDNYGNIWMCRTWFDYKGHNWSVIHGLGSYGGIEGLDIDHKLLEVMSDAIGGDVVGFLKADDIWKLMNEKG